MSDHRPPDEHQHAPGECCTARTLTGEACRARPLTGSDRCLSHSPSHAELLRVTRSKGGLHKRRRPVVGEIVAGHRLPDLATVEGVRATLEKALTVCLAAEASLSQAKALAQIALAAARVIELTDQEKRLSRLEDLALDRINEGAA